MSTVSPRQTPTNVPQPDTLPRVSWAHSCTQDAQVPQTLQVFGEAPLVGLKEAICLRNGELSTQYLMETGVPLE